EKHGLASDYQHTGMFRVAYTPRQLRRLEKTHALLERLGVASDMRFAMQDLIADFVEERPEDAQPINLRVTYGSSGNFYAQLTHRAPFDMYFSADVRYPARLVEDGLALEGSLFEYAIGRLVIWVPKASTLDVEALQWETLKSEGARRIAIANPEHAPYGQAAVAAMKTAELYDDVSKKLVNGENIAQAAQFIESGAADTGIIALALALAPAMADKGRYWEIPTDTFPTMVQGGLITRWTKHPEVAREFRAHVLGPRGRKILEEYGFFLPDEKPQE
ncbi:MAG: molybdate ABC transporter substrate-binding protein, partial [Bradymonadaceae bacterium]